jgi:hypothetical protein
MIIGRVFGPDSPYIERLTSIEFRYKGIAVSSVGGGSSPATNRARERAWQSGQERSIALVGTMLEDLALGAPEQAQGWVEPTTPSSNRVFVVHGHDREMKQAVARTIERIGLEAVILHEQPNRGQTLIEKIERFSNVGFAVVLLSTDDTPKVLESPLLVYKRVQGGFEGPRSVRRLQKKRAMFSISVAKYRPHRPYPHQCGGLQDFLAVCIYRHHPRRGIYRPHLTDSDRGSKKRDRRFCESS